MFAVKRSFSTARLFTTIFFIFGYCTAMAGIECEFNVTQSWGSGGNGSIAVTNTGSSPVTLDPITAEFPAGIAVTSSWHMKLTGSNPYTFTPHSWNATVPAGQTVYAGMSLSGSVNSGTEAILGGACSAGPAVNVPPVAALSCQQATMIADPPPGGNFAIETYTVHCNNQSTDPDGDTLESVFDWGDGTVNTETSHRYVASGDYTILLSVSDGELMDFASVQVAADGNTEPPEAVLNCDITDGRTVACDGSASSDPDGEIIGYVFDWNDGPLSAGGSTATHTYSENGSYEITMIVTDGHNTVSDTAVVLINDIADEPLEAEFSYTMDGLRVNVDVPYDGTAGITHTWNWGDGTANSNGFPQSHTYAQAGTYTITLTLTDEAGRTGSVSHDVTVTDASEPEAPGSCRLSASNFSTGFVYSIELSNVSDSAFSDWEVCVLLDDESVVNNSFNSRPVEPALNDGNWVCFGPASWNYTLIPGQAISFGFMGSGPGVILDVSGACDSLE